MIAHTPARYSGKKVRMLLARSAIAAMLHVELNDKNKIVFSYTDAEGKEIKESVRYL